MSIEELQALLRATRTEARGVDRFEETGREVQWVRPAGFQSLLINGDGSVNVFGGGYNGFYASLGALADRVAAGARRTVEANAVRLRWEEA